MRPGYTAEVFSRDADITTMRLGLWLKITASAIALVLLMRFVSTVPPAHSGERFQNSHSKIECSECHALRAQLGAGGADPIHREQCERCHTPEATTTSGIPLGFHSDRSRGCPECHSFHKVEEISARGQAFLVSFENSFQRAQCYSCHKPLARLSDLSPGHRAAAGIYHSDFSILGKLTSSESCLICHSESPAWRLEDVSAYAEQAPRFSEHGSHPVSVAVRPGGGEPGNRICFDIDSRIQLFGGRIECQSCHSLTSTNQHRLIAFDTKSDLCRACHQFD